MRDATEHRTTLDLCAASHEDGVKSGVEREQFQDDLSALPN